MVARPQPGRPETFSLPSHQRATIGEGLQVTFVPAGALPRADIRLVLDAGALYETAEQTWLSRLTSDYLREGTEDLDAVALAEAVASLGGRFDVDAGDDTLTLHASALAEHAPEMLRLLAEVARKPRFPDAEMPRLKNDLHRQLALARAQPQTLALDRFRAALYGDHPYGRVFPADETIEAFTTDSARRFFADHTGAGRARLYVAGRFDAQAVLDTAEAAFAGWQTGMERPDLSPAPRSERAVHLLDRPGAEQSTIYMGLPAPTPIEPDWIAMHVTNALLGGSFYSRITLNLREDKGYTYSPRSVVSARLHDAYWAEVADVATPVTGASLHEIFAEIERLSSDAPERDELEGIQRYVAGTHLLRFATPGGILGQLAFLDLQGLPESYAEAFIARAYAVTPQEVQATARKYLLPEQMTIVVVGDAGRIAEQLEPYGPLIREDLHRASAGA